MVDDRFDQMRDDGAEVERPRVLYMPLSRFKNTEVLVWRIRRHSNEEWAEYVWELHAVSPETLEVLAQRGLPTDGWWGNWTSILLPANEAALRIHEELAVWLPLPAGFSLGPNQEYDEQTGGADSPGHDEVNQSAG